MAPIEAGKSIDAGDWIGSFLLGLPGTVSSLVPGYYSSFARIFHPVRLYNGTGNTTWENVARTSGRITHPVMQWSSISTSPSGTRSPSDEHFKRWAAGEPELGTLDHPSLKALIDILSKFTSHQICYQAIWDGWGFFNEGAIETVELTSDGEAGAPSIDAPRPMVEDIRISPKLRLPGRSYFLVQGMLSDALVIGGVIDPRSSTAQSPNMMWPADRTWFVATEIDLDSTIVAGPDNLTASLLDSPLLETSRILASSDLSSSGDKVNA